MKLNYNTLGIDIGSTTVKIAILNAKGEIVFSEIHFNPDNVDSSLAQKKLKFLSRHETGHALGLRHPFEFGEAGTVIALMHPDADSSDWRETFQDYDYQELRKTFPQ